MPRKIVFGIVCAGLLVACGKSELERLQEENARLHKEVRGLMQEAAKQAEIATDMAAVARVAANNAEREWENARKVEKLLKECQGK